MVSIKSRGNVTTQIAFLHYFIDTILYEGVVFPKSVSLSIM